ncbi:MAG: XisH family protein [Snowella sp.]|nr:XisH family protein [Snowella sp.]
MPAKDIFHDCVKRALIKDGWTITDDPLSLKIGKKDLFIDLAAEKMLMAERGTEKIAVEIKSFVGTSEVEDLKNALGQYVLYEKIIKRQLLHRTLYLAIRETTYNTGLFHFPVCSFVHLRGYEVLGCMKTRF